MTVVLGRALQRFFNTPVSIGFFRVLSWVFASRDRAISGFPNGISLRLRTRPANVVVAGRCWRAGGRGGIIV